MLRTLVIALAIAAPGVASAQQQFPESAVGIEVRGDDGSVVGRVDAVERDRNGRIVAVAVSGQEPGAAPYASSDLVAQSERNQTERVNARESDTVRANTGGSPTRTR